MNVPVDKRLNTHEMLQRNTHVCVCARVYVYFGIIHMDGPEQQNCLLRYIQRLKSVSRSFGSFTNLIIEVKHALTMDQPNKRTAKQKKNPLYRMTNNGKKDNIVIDSKWFNCQKRVRSA